MPTFVATCVEDGLSTRYCSCGATETKIVPAKNHAPGPWEIVRLPTMSEAGLRQWKCITCDEIVQKEQIPKLEPAAGLAYRINSDGKTCTITGPGTCRDVALLIPSQIEGYAVTAIADHAFANCAHLIYFSAMEGLASIGDRAFDSCVSLRAIDLPNSIKEIGFEAFEHIGLYDSFSSYQVNGCVISLAGSLKNHTISSKERCIAYGIWGKDSYVETIQVESDHPSYVVYDGMLFSKDMTQLIVCPTKREGTVTVPDSVKRIAPYAFMNCTKVTEIILPNGLEEIGNGAFKNCDDLITIAIPKSLVKIGKSIFADCNLGSITVDEENTVFSAHGKGIYSKDGTIFYTSCTKVNQVVAEGVTQLAEGAFYEQEMMVSVTLPNSLKKISDYAFYGCERLSCVSFPDGLEEIGNFAFVGCRYITHNERLSVNVTLKLPNTVRKIGDYAFAGCSMVNHFELPDSLVHIGDFAFYNCRLAESINIPQNVTHIGAGAFTGCERIVIEIAEENKHFEGGVSWLYSADGSKLIVVSQEMTGTAVIPSGVKEIGASALYHVLFAGVAGKTVVYVPLSVERIGDFALFGVYMPIGLTDFAYNCQVMYEGTEQQWNEIVKGFEIGPYVVFYQQAQPT